MRALKLIAVIAALVTLSGAAMLLLDQQPVDIPTFFFVWILAIAVIGGLLLVLTRLKPAWFRVFISGTYTSLPIAVMHYSQSNVVGFVAIAALTIALTALFFNKTKTTRYLSYLKKLETGKE